MSERDRGYRVNFRMMSYPLSSSGSGRSRARTPTRATVPGWTRAGGCVALAAGFRTRLPGWEWREGNSPFAVTLTGNTDT